jgi:hypothetical protein
MCALPVASRNFSKRHSHGMVGPPRFLGGMKRANDDYDDEYDEVPTKKARMGDISRTVEVPDHVGSAARVELTSQEQKFLDLMNNRPPDDSPYLSSWIQSVLDLTSYVSANVPKQTTLPESLNVFECYERDQLQDAVLEDDDDEERSVDSGFVFEMGGEFSHGA